MRRLRFVYICDFCGKASLGQRDCDGDSVEPGGWRMLGRMHLCPDCAEQWAMSGLQCRHKKEKELK